MKKVVTLLSFLIVATLSFAQKVKVTTAISYKDAGEIQKAQCQPLSLNLGQQGTLEILDAKCAKTPAQADATKK